MSNDTPQTDGGAVELDETSVVQDAEVDLDKEEPQLPPELEGIEFAGEAPDPGAIAVAEDFRHKRGKDKELLPVWEEIPGTGQHILVKPVTNGEANEVLDEEDPEPSSLTERDQMNIINEFILWPKFELEKPEDLEDFGAFGLDPLVMTVYNASGWNYARGLVADNIDLMQLLEGNSKPGS